MVIRSHCTLALAHTTTELVLLEMVVAEVDSQKVGPLVAWALGIMRKEEPANASATDYKKNQTITNSLFI